jgi:subtilisin family serine protease
MRKIIQLYFLLFFSFAFSQTELVFVYFKDKPNASIFLSNPLSELTQKSINRRTNLNIPITEQDAPIETSYIQNIQNLGFTVTDQSKWLNGVAVNATFAQITQLQSEPYVLKVESFVKNNTVAKQAKISRIEKFLNSTTDFTYGNSLDQINQINLRNLHVNGYTGAGISIAVIDTGFPTVDTGSAFARIRNNNQIKGGYNFVNKSTDIYNTSLNNHGTNCLGIIAGYIDGIFVGSAPDADFYLYASENSALEIPEEELYIG